ncbi:hypothetical protein [Roseivirga sp. 4D4]|uniref:hypothetical protein n=1 Tax=Roseivirga sp. 4D4 TaxID=1889784 RepID=UPI001112EDFC|nr:hypothetical protein [Roseivirga sp. 4D4]
MRKSYIFCVLIIILIHSCGPKENPNVYIINESSVEYEKVYIRSSAALDSTYLGALGYGEELKGQFVITDSVPSDGCFMVIAIRSSGLVHRECMGYYTNSSSLNRGFRLTLKDDSTMIESS